MKEVRLGEVAEKIGSGATPRGGERVYRRSGIPFVRSQNVYNDGFNPEGLVFIDAEHAEELDYVGVRAGDNLLDITGESVARTCLAPNSLDGGRVSQHVAIVRVKPAQLDYRFLHYALVSPILQTELLSLASAGATRQALTKAMIEDLRVPCPPLSEQRAIASILGSLDDKIELNRRMTQTLEQIAQALFRFWFVDFGPVRAKAEGRWKKGESLPGMPADMWDLWPSEFDESEIGEAPKGWEVTTMGPDVRFEKGRKPSEVFDEPGENLLAVVEMSSIEGNYSQWARQIGSVACQPDDCLMVMDGASSGRVTTGHEGVVSSTFAKLVPTEGTWAPCRLYWTLRQLETELRSNPTGTSIPHVDKALVSSSLILRPAERGIEARFDRVVRPLMNRLPLNWAESHTLSATRDTLLPKLLSGEIRVPSDGGQ